ncbi:MAG: hypothetical protein KAR42_06490 [candidate division Zixibacteria bacterium]|nr:hypothetical protein [candidate division Zixibacteria bacterium]
MSFSMNFTVDLDEDRRLMNVKIYGIWKRETARSYHDEFREVAQPLVGKEWAKIINLSNWRPSYPEMDKVIGDHMRWSKKNGNTLAIYIIDNPVTKNQLKKMFSHGSTGPISKMVKSREEAEKILVEHGFK